MASETSSPPRVGVGVFVFHRNDTSKFILGKRKGNHGSGTLALPGGHLEYGESFEECATREVLEETGLHIEIPKFLTATNSVFDSTHKHYVTVFMTATISDDNAEPKNLEPDKCESWLWFSFQAMRQHINNDQSPLFLPLINLIKQRADVCEKLQSGQWACASV